MHRFSIDARVDMQTRTGVRVRFTAARGEDVHTAGDSVPREWLRLLPEEDRTMLEELEFRDRLFPDLDLAWWAGTPAKV